MLFGKPTSLQCCIYNKTKQIVKIDAVDYYNDKWSLHPAYNAELAVFRIELRFHHSVIRDIGNGILDSSSLDNKPLEFESFIQVHHYLTDIWRYGLNRNRLDHNKKYIEPIWQLIFEDVDFYKPLNSIYITRQKKKDVTAISKNLGLILGNLISCAARERMNVVQVMVGLKNLFIYPMIIKTLIDSGIDEKDTFITLYQKIEKGLKERQLNSRYV